MAMDEGMQKRIGKVVDLMEGRFTIFDAYAYCGGFVHDVEREEAIQGGKQAKVSSELADAYARFEDIKKRGKEQAQRIEDAIRMANAFLEAKERAMTENG